MGATLQAMGRMGQATAMGLRLPMVDGTRDVVARPATDVDIVPGPVWPAGSMHIHAFSALFWTAMFAMHTLQTALVNQYTDLASIAWRALFSAFGFTLCLPLGWALRRSLAWDLRYKVLAMALVCVPTSVTYAALGHIVWFDLLGHQAPYSALVNIAMQSLYNLVLFLMWSGFCAAILYAARLRERERSLLEARALAHQAELQMLRYQINPHFLFNTLNAVSALVVTGQLQTADQVIAKLARFFRTALNREAAAKVTLGEEIRVQAEYLDIELTRFGDRVRFTTAIADGLEAALVPHLILQPLIENAVKHGVARIAEPVTISVRATRSARTLVLAVENDAPANRAPRLEHAPARGPDQRGTAPGELLRQCGRTCGDGRPGKL